METPLVYKIINIETLFIIHTWKNNTFKETVLNRALSSLHGGSLEITRKFPFRRLIVQPGNIEDAMKTVYLCNKARHSWTYIYICSLWPAKRLNRIGWHFLSTHIFFHGQFGYFSFLKLVNYFPALNGWGFYVLLDGGRGGGSCSWSIPIKSVGL